MKPIIEQFFYLLFINKKPHKAIGISHVEQMVLVERQPSDILTDSVVYLGLHDLRHCACHDACHGIVLVDKAVCVLIADNTSILIVPTCGLSHEVAIDLAKLNENRCDARLLNVLVLGAVDSVLANF